MEFSICSFKNNTSFVSRFNTLRRGRSYHHGTANKLQAANASNDNLVGGNTASSTAVATNPDQQCALSREASLKKGQSDGKCI